MESARRTRPHTESTLAVTFAAKAVLAACAVVLEMRSIRQFSVKLLIMFDHIGKLYHASGGLG